MAQEAPVAPDPSTTQTSQAQTEQPAEAESEPASDAGENSSLREPTSLREPISTDRPDVGTSASTVGAGVVQIETGIQLNREDGQDFTTFPTLFRFGIADHWEFRLESDFLILQNPGVDAFADVNLSTKVTLHDGDSTKIGLLLGVNIPVGPEELRGTVDPELKFLWDQDLGGDWSVGVNVGLALTEDDDEERFGQYNWAASFSHPITDSLDGYLELYGEGPDQSHGKSSVGADTGLLYRLNDDLQIDVFYARGLSSFGPEWSVGGGLSTRF